MNDLFTVEEINLMCIYDTSSRPALLSALQMSLVDVYEPEMQEIIINTISKLKKLSDVDFAEIGFYPAEEFAIEGGSDIAE